MELLNKLIDQAAERCNPPNDTGLAKSLRVSKSAVSLWRKGGKITTRHLARLVERAKADPAFALQVLHEQGDEQEREVWAPLLRRLTSAAAIAIALCVVPLGNTQAKTGTYAASSADYILCSLRRRIRYWLRRKLRRPERGSVLHA